MPEELIEAAAVVSRYVVAFVFLAAAIPKLVDRSAFELAVRNYGLVPERVAPAVAAWLPPVEMLCALALILGIAVSLVGLLSAALLVVFAVAVAVNLLRGRSIDCGCQGSVATRRIGWSLVAGNLALAGLAVTAARLDPGTLSLTASADSSISNPDGLALAIVGAGLVLCWLLVGSVRDLRNAGRRLELQLESGR